MSDFFGIKTGPVSPKGMMTSIKTVLFALCTFACTSLSQAGDFHSDYETAKKKAKEENKPLLVKFTGSDWCPPCKALDAAIFSQEKFKKEVEKDFVVAVLDFPKQKELPEGQKEKNQKAKNEFDVSGFPTVLLINQEGKVIKKMVGFGGGDVESYLEVLQTALKAQKFL